MRLHVLISIAILYPFAVLGNVEKTIFVAPPPTTMPETGPTLDNLCLNKLQPSSPKLRTPLPVKFPHKETPHGLQSWYILDNLSPGKRYEVRICWPATVRVLSNPWAAVVFFSDLLTYVTA
jgi:hypothetical protein